MIEDELLKLRFKLGGEDTLRRICEKHLGAGKAAADPNAGRTILAYGKTILREGKGTYVVFRAGRAEFIEPKRLAEYGLPTNK